MSESFISERRELARRSSAGCLGPAGIRGYYDAVPDRSADVTILSTYTIGEQTAGGFADVTFSDPAGRQGGGAAGGA